MKINQVFEGLDAKGVAAEILRELKQGNSGSDTQGPEDWGKEGWYVGVRDWGRWENDYDDEDDDSDHQILSTGSRKDLKTLFDKFDAKYPAFKISGGTGEKNWIEVTVKAK